MKPLHLVFIVALAVTLISPTLAKDEIYQRGFLSLEDAHNAIEVPDGYQLELLLAEPQIKEPVAVAWDGNGAMYVVEMRTYMQNIDARGEKEPISRISKHVDTNGDGTYDKHSVFIDKLLLPRMVLPLDDRIMVGVTDTLDLWTYRDTDDDGVADEKVKIHEGGKRGGNMEHQPSGLIWAIDNWIYLTYESVRYRFTDGKLVTERLPRGAGQWGLTQDNHGRIFYSTAGGENPAFYYQQPPQYGMINVDEQTAKDFRTVYPIAAVPDVQGGLRRVGPSGGLNNFTGCAGQGVFRGDRLPEELRNQLFIPEPVGRLVRLANVERSNGRTVLSNATPGTEFMRSRDVNFRPLGAKTMPDGRLALVDMHRGIIQQGNWVGKGSYLRPVVQKWGLEKNFGKGRIYRLVHKDFDAGPQPRMMDQSTAELVRHLNHPNGWWRDTAQRMIILRADRESVVPQLKQLATRASKPLTRIHALWTLEGIGAVTPELLLTALSDSDATVVAAAIRNAEPFLKVGEPSVMQKLIPLKDHADAEVYLQLFNSVDYALGQGADAEQLTPLLDATTDIAATYKDNPVIRAVTRGRAAMAQERARRAEQAKQDARFGKVMDHGGTIYKQLCFTCHGNDGKGTPMPGQAGVTLAPAFAGSARLGGSGANMVRTILHGLAGPIDGKTYPGIMAPMQANDDEWVAAVSTYVQNTYGPKSKRGQEVTPAFVAALRQQHTERGTPWTVPELEELEPPLLVNRDKWTLTSSHNQGSCDAAVDGDPSTRYTTSTPQKPGQWLRVKLPKKSRVNRIVLDSSRSAHDYPRGYEIRVSDDGKSWSDPILDGDGRNAVTDLGFASIETSHIEIKQTGTIGNKYWSIHELEIYGKEL